LVEIANSPERGFFSGKNMRYKNILDTIGNTPVVKIQKLNPNLQVSIYAKLEGNNPGGSVKDRVAKYMIEEAEERGLLSKDKIILEPTSGNTGIGLAMITAFKGYKFTAVLPANSNPGLKKILKAYGAEIILSSFNGGTNGAIKTARKVVKQDKRRIMLDQFNNLANVLVHYQTTGTEIVRDIPQVDVFVAGMGTGGTLMGVGRKLKEHNQNIKIIGVEPDRKSKIPGLRNMTAYTPFVFDESQLDRKVNVKEKEAFRMAKLLFSKEGISAGPSSGAAMWGAIQIAKRMEKGSIVVLFPDRGDRYLSTELSG